LRSFCLVARSMSDCRAARGNSVNTMAMGSHGTILSNIHSQLKGAKVFEWYSKASSSSIAAMKTLSRC
jgi:hypothetical protein